jgi:hypothetical protein
MSEQQQAKAYDPTTLGQEPEDEPGALRDEDGNLLPSFDPKYAEPLKGLAFIGALSTSFTWLGHEFVIRTLRDGEKLAVAQIIKEFADTMGADRAYGCAIAAMCTMSVDGEELPVPIGESRRSYEWGLQRFNYVKDTWFPFTVDKVFNEYVALEDLAAKTVEAMGKASAPEDSNPSSSEF